ncbi:orf66-like protein [Malacosoma neustria nucleopolyhedrovirus]|uniref:orf66-like protein n=1 Tax=Malacosoma neustria nuclear polyhedrosis virus TaxID=38012 RepID=UPI000E35ABFF|nr:orf66-like protein [Malacosoma neustria nucleopolyhedrovirus]AUF81630.1 orf66-like protein [Malacosoma neustria nucleopolyhedrovirus]
MNTYFCYNEKYVDINGDRLCLNCCSKEKVIVEDDNFAFIYVALHMQHKLIGKQELDANQLSNINRCNKCCKKIIVIENVDNCDECSMFMSIVEDSNVSSSSSSFC